MSEMQGRTQLTWRRRSFSVACGALKQAAKSDGLRYSVLLFAVTLSFAASRSVWDGVYTKEQARRGQTVYREECMKCHGENLMGGEAGPPIAGEEFLKAWGGRTAGDFFEKIRKSMPEDDPGNLSTRQYSDVVAYIFSVTNFPAGQTELDRDAAALKEIRIEAKKE